MMNFNYSYNPLNDPRLTKRDIFNICSLKVGDYADLEKVYCDANVLLTLCEFLSDKFTKENLFKYTTTTNNNVEVYIKNIDDFEKKSRCESYFEGRLKDKTKIDYDDSVEMILRNIKNSMDKNYPTTAQNNLVSLKKTQSIWRKTFVTLRYNIRESNNNKSSSMISKFFHLSLYEEMGLYDSHYFLTQNLSTFEKHYDTEFFGSPFTSISKYYYSMFDFEKGMKNKNEGTCLGVMRDDDRDYNIFGERVLIHVPSLPNICESSINFLMDILPELRSTTVDVILPYWKDLKAISSIETSEYLIKKEVKKMDLYNVDKYCDYRKNALYFCATLANNKKEHQCIKFV
jgi:hypothetical protein